MRFKGVIDLSSDWRLEPGLCLGKHLATYIAATTYFVHADWLGTERARSKMTGQLCESVASLPFGDGQTITYSNGCTADTSPLHFTGKQRDPETNLDDFGARYFSSTAGRWMSPDWAANAVAVPYANFGKPQSLNLYAYVGNDPIDGEDSDGHSAGTKDERKLLDKFAQAMESLKIAMAKAQLLKTATIVGQTYTQIFKSVAKAETTAAHAVASGLTQNPNFSFSHITGHDLNNVGKNLTLGLAAVLSDGAALEGEVGGASSEGEFIRGTNQPGQLTSRSSLRASTIQADWDNAADGPTGGKLCPTCGVEVHGSPQSGLRDWDVDHQPKWTDRKFSPGTTRQRVIDNYQEGTRLRCVACNRADNQ